MKFPTYPENHVKTVLKIGVEEDSKSSRRYVSANIASTWFLYSAAN